MYLDSLAAFIVAIGLRDAVVFAIYAIATVYGYTPYMLELLFRLLGASAR